MAITSGVILLWSGAIADIPAGYFLCDGNNGTPDLRNRFLIGAGTTFNPDDSGGTLNHTHDFAGDGHAHDHPAGTGIAAGTDWRNTTNTGISNGETDAASSLPPYYALAFIMKT